MKHVVCALAPLALMLGVASSAHAQSVAGDWQGTLKIGLVELRLVVHVTQGEQGALKGTVDSPDQGANGIPISTIASANHMLKFDVGVIMGSYEGTVNDAATAITGTWTQRGMSFPLDLARAPAVQARARTLKPSDIDGDWRGGLTVQATTLQIILHITTYDDGMTAKMDVPDQNAVGLPATSIARDGSTVKFEMKQLGASFSGTLDKELASITGTWGQLGNFQPLVLKKTSKP